MNAHRVTGGSGEARMLFIFGNLIKLRDPAIRLQYRMIPGAQGAYKKLIFLLPASLTRVLKQKIFPIKSISNYLIYYISMLHQTSQANLFDLISNQLLCYQSVSKNFSAHAQLPKRFNDSTGTEDESAFARAQTLQNIQYPCGQQEY